MHTQQQPCLCSSCTQQALDSKDALYSTLASSQLALGHPGELALKWSKVPLGSVRASLGWMSTFEDCYALVEFIQRRYRDRLAATEGV